MKSSAAHIDTQTSNRRRRTGWLSLTGLRRCLFYQPLAVFMAVTMLPPFSWVTGASQVSTVLAQSNIGGCAPDASRIIQDLGGVCDANWASTADVQQFESEMASTWLQIHQLQETDISMIYQYGRTDLRSELRGYMLQQLLQIIGKPSTERTTHEQALYTGFQKKVQQHEIELYTAALNEYYRFGNDPCHWTLDPDLAKQYNLSFDGTSYCVTGQGRQNYAPSYDYFIAYGLKNSYGKAVSDHQNGPLVQTYTGISLGLAAGAIALPTAVISGLIVGGLVFKYMAQIFPYAFRAGVATISEVGEAGVVAVVVVIAIMTTIVGAIEVFESDANARNLATLSSQLASAKANPPDLASFLPDQTGMYKLTATFTGLTLPDFPSPLPLPEHQDTDLDFLVTSGGQPENPDGSLGYKDWFGTSWSAKTYGGSLVQTGITKTGQAVDSITPTILYTDWSGNPYSASRRGNNFLIAKALPASTDTECKADETTGVTAIILPTCSSYVAPSFQLMDHTERVDQGVTLIENGPQYTISLKNPGFTSPAQITFVVGTAKTFQVTAKGIPAPVIYGYGQLPDGISWTAGNPAGTPGTLSGTATAGTEGVYPLTWKARNTAGIVTQNFTLNVVPSLAFTSSSNAVFTGGQPGSFTITTTGKPTPSLAIGMPLPAGLSFKDNGDGTATISGTPAAPTRNPPPIISCAFTGCGVLATNVLGSVLQPLTITVNPTPLTIATSPPGLQFTISSADGQTCPASGPYTSPKTLDFYLEDKCVIAFASPISGGTGTQYLFQNWGLVASNPRIVTAPPFSTTYTAFFVPQYYLTTSAGPGGAISPASGWVGGLNFTSWSTSVTVTATPSAGYAFTGFTGNLSGPTNPQTINMTAPQSVTANFGLITATATSNPVARVTSAGGTGSFELTASFQLPPALQGVDLSTAVPVTATLNPLVGTTTTPISCPASTSVASGVLTATASCSSVPVNVYEATLTVGGSYISASSTSVISVFDPSLGAVQGGGSLLANGVTGTFAVEVKYNKNAQPQGGVSYIAHKPGANVKLKSNSLQSMSIVGNTAVILGKATLDGVGGYAFTATVVDQSATGDLFGLQVTDPSGKAVPGLSFSPVQLRDGGIELPK